jgi:hypothetical protein
MLKRAQLNADACAPDSQRVLLLRQVEEHVQRALQDVVAGVLRLARDVADDGGERQEDSNAWHGAGRLSCARLCCGQQRAAAPTMAPSTSGAARPFSNRKAGSATPTLMPVATCLLSAAHGRRGRARTLRPIRVAVLLQVRTRRLIRERLRERSVKACGQHTQPSHASRPCTPAR